jgi:hypothetical protein
MMESKTYPKYPAGAKASAALVEAKTSLTGRVVEVEQVVRSAGVLIEISDALFGNTGW